MPFAETLIQDSCHLRDVGHFVPLLQNLLFQLAIQHSRVDPAIHSADEARV